MSAYQLYIFTVLSLIVFVSEILVRKTFFKHFGTALLVILVTAVVANLGLIPTSSSEENPVPVYDFIFGTLAPLSILWLLLKVNLRDVLKAGLPIIFLFIVGSFATAAGVVIGMKVINGPEAIGPLYNAIGGMFTGTYSGGSINFNAVALHYDVMKEGVLFGGAVAVDNIITAIWMALCIAVPTVLRRFWPIISQSNKVAGAKVDLGISEDTESLHPMDLALTLLIGTGVLSFSDWSSSYLLELGYGVPSILILTIAALILAQFPFVNKLKGPRMLGLFSVYVFLAVIGAYCDFSALSSIGSLGMSLLVFTLVIIVVHGVITFGVARLFKMDLDMAAVASQANIGGSTSALALARSLGRKDLVLPAVLIGSLGNALGTFLGFWIAGIL
jgi:uncharacterized membrane protein